MKKILVPTDFSDQANAAVNLAIDIAEKFNAEIHLIHIMAIPIDWPRQNNDEKLYPDISKNINQKTRKLDILKNDVIDAGVACNSLILFNEDQSGIANYAQKNLVDLIVMGSKGSSGLKELVVGSNAEKAIRFAKCPVMIIKTPVLLRNVKKILFATDLNSSQNEIAQLAKKWSENLSSELIISKLNTHYRWVDSLKFVEEIESFASENEIDNFTAKIYDTDYLEDGIVKCAEEVDADMIIMGTHQRTGLAHIIAGSVAEDVANHAKRLILTVAI